LIEADGAKRLPLKVPGEWEPVIPDFTDLVVGVIGMDAVGQMIRESCHRPERVAAFLNKEQTDPVTEADVIRIAVSDKALKKAVGRRPYKIFLNKTDLMGKYESAERIGKELQEQGVHAAWGSLQGREYYR
ncbi:MAG: selenium cofactor biosynthesis protein YqeC, partial [Lachnospiraceae bacterium]